RAALFEEAPDRFVLVFTMHHAISDAWSVGVFLRELVTLYGGGAPDPLPVTYGDYVDWERSWLEGGVLAEQLDYWKDRLEDLPPLLPLPTDRPRPEVQSSHGETVELAPPEGLLEELKRLGTGAGCSLFVTLTAALALLLHRYSSQRDLAIGTGVANRRRPELEGLIGYFVNTLVLRTRVEPEESFAALLGATREVVQGGLAHRDAPYHRVVEHVRPDRATGHTPFLQVMLTLQNVPYERSVALPGLTLEAEVPASGAAKFDLSIALQQEGGELRGQIEYRSDLFDRATVERLAGQYVRLLREVVARPEAPVWSHDLLGAAERRMLSVEWSGAGRLGAGSGDRDAGVYALFEERARAHPESVALVDGDRSLTYGALSRRAERLADHLRERGVAPDALVGICAERSLEMVVGILGVLAADAAYLPLDPDNPVERTRFALREAEAELVLTTAAMAPKVPVAGDRLVLLDLPDLDTLPDRPAGEPPRRADRGGSALAYVMYTSGSTGEPKGVAVEHRGIVRLVREPDWIELDRDTVTLQHSPPSFDASTLELWAPLLNGGRLVLRREDSADVEDLARQVARHRVDTLWLTAGVLPLWVPHHPAGSAPDGTGAGLRYLLAGGDVVPPGAVREIYARDPRVVVINGYGPTENTTFSCCHPVPRDARTDGGLPIGRPIRGSSATVLDEHLQLVPVGGVGQLFVGGAGVARGYLRRPGLTAERFVPSPVPGEDGGAADRLYRTGDSVRWTNDGVLEFLGRTDNQVKVRGFRIELEEIEVQLVGLPEVELGAVVLRDDPGLGKRIVAYAVVGERPEGEERASTIARLKESMRRRVPEYMVPALFVLCDHLPLTPNGKVDRRALPDPGEEDLPRSDYRPPSTATERALCAIWEEVLQVERVGLDDDFFDLGGHSLLATQLVARVRERLGRGLPLAELFQGPTVAGVAARLAGEPEAGGGPAGPESLPELVPDPATRHEPFPMTGVQQAYCFGRYGAFELGNVATHAYVEMDLRDLDVARLERAWNALVRRHDMLRAVFSSADGTQRILPEVPDYEVVCEDLRGLPPEEAEERLGRTRGRMSHQVFALDEWPLFEVR
ncbi:MAG: amino acid adenylation domain-containing protein, partial [Acidobacteriota bacterium]